MPLPDGLKKIFGAETQIAAPREPKQFVPAEWSPLTNRRDEVRVFFDEDAANFYNDGLSDAQLAGIKVEAELLARKQR